MTFYILTIPGNRDKPENFCISLQWKRYTIKIDQSSTPTLIESKEECLRIQNILLGYGTLTEVHEVHFT